VLKHCFAHDGTRSISADDEIELLRGRNARLRGVGRCAGLDIYRIHTGFKLERQPFPIFFLYERHEGSQDVAS